MAPRSPGLALASQMRCHRCLTAVGARGPKDGLALQARARTTRVRTIPAWPPRPKASQSPGAFPGCCSWDGCACPSLSPRGSPAPGSSMMCKLKAFLAGRSPQGPPRGLAKRLFPLDCLCVPSCAVLHASFTCTLLGRKKHSPRPAQEETDLQVSADSPGARTPKAQAWRTRRVL